MAGGTSVGSGVLRWASLRARLDDRLGRHPWSRRATLLWVLIAVELVAVTLAMHPWLAPDSRQYLALGRELLDGRYGVVRAGTFMPELLHPPGYPVYLMVLVGIARLPNAALVASQALLFLGGVLLVHRLLVRYELSPVPFLVIVALYPATMAYSVRILSEGPAIFVVAGLVYVLAVPGPFSFRRVVGLGLLTGTSIMLRPSLILLPLVVGPLLGLLWRRSGRQRQTLAALALFFAAVSVVLAPYVLVNYRQVGQATPLPPAAAVGYSVYASTYDQGDRTRERRAEDGKPAPEDSSEFSEERRRINEEIDAALAERDRNEPAAEELTTGKVYRSQAWQRVRDHPFTYARQVAFNWWRLWNTAEYPDGTPALAKAGFQIAGAGVWALGLGGAVLTLMRWRRRRAPAALGAAALVLLYFPFVHAFMVSTARYTAPGRLLLQLFASLLVLDLLKRRRSRQPATTAEPGAQSTAAVT